MSSSKMLIILSFLLGVPAFAQFEVSPDHFDEDAQKPPAQQAKARTKIKLTRQTTTSAVAPAQQRTQGQATVTTAQRESVPALQPAAGAKRNTSIAASTRSGRKRLQKPKTVPSLQPVGKSVAEARAPR
ncbi:MAG TPA: hypothetical protein VN176_17375 [Verrucomicrobiae bacterium]|jgi:hypothetical protein|nr:hypothetical protein [Verrucomicrobiae bacterium]